MTRGWWLAVGVVIGLGMYWFAAEQFLQTFTTELDTAITAGLGGLLVGFCGTLLWNYLKRGRKT